MLTHSQGVNHRVTYEGIKKRFVHHDRWKHKIQHFEIIHNLKAPINLLKCFSLSKVLITNTCFRFNVDSETSSIKKKILNKYEDWINQQCILRITWNVCHKHCHYVSKKLVFYIFCFIMQKWYNCRKWNIEPNFFTNKIIKTAVC